MIKILSHHDWCTSWCIQPANLRFASSFEWADRKKRRRFFTFPQILATVGRFVGGRGEGKEGFVVPQGLFLLTSLTGRRLLASFSIILERWRAPSLTCIDAAGTKNGAKNWNYSSIFPRNALITSRRFLEVSWNTVNTLNNFKLFFAAEKEGNLSRIFLFPILNL